MKSIFIFLLFFSYSHHSNANELHHYLSDPQNKVMEDFSIDQRIMKRVLFWYDIYTLHDSKTAVFHDAENLNIVYHVLNTKGVASDQLKKDIRHLLVKDYRKKYYNLYKNALNRLKKGSCSREYCKKILHTYRKANVKIPRRKKDRQRFFEKRIDHLRVQTGQRDKILNGLKNIDRYQQTLDKIFEVHGLPRELLAIALLESSFNTKAKSKVNATGPWQFMKFIGKHFLVIDRYRDQRRNPFLSTSAALHLLRQNKKILKRWDLAINAYNSGTGNILKGVRYLKKRKFKDPSVVDLVNNYHSKSFQFASKNFYAEFLALAHIIPYREIIYEDFKKSKSKPPLSVYLTKCRNRINRSLKSIKSSSYELSDINNHLSSRNLSFPKGTVIFSDIKLTSRKYLKIKFKNFKKYYPKKLYKLARRYKCSKR